MVQPAPHSHLERRASVRPNARQTHLLRPPCTGPSPRAARSPQMGRVRGCESETRAVYASVRRESVQALWRGSGGCDRDGVIGDGDGAHGHRLHSTQGERNDGADGRNVQIRSHRLDHYWKKRASSRQAESFADQGRLTHNALFADGVVAEILCVGADAAIACERAAFAAGEEADVSVTGEVEVGVADEAFDGGFERALEVGEHAGHELATEVQRKGVAVFEDTDSGEA